MTNAGSVVAHLFKLIVTLICMRYLESPYLIFSNESGWSTGAFQILLLHSILGVLTFGTSESSTGKRTFRNLYDAFSETSETVPFALLATEISLRCGVNETLRQQLLLALCIAPIAHELLRKKCRRTFRLYMNIPMIIQLFTIFFVCLKLGYSSVISLTASYVLHRYYLEELCDRFDVPYIDLAQYSMSFVEIFATISIKEM